MLVGFQTFLLPLHQEAQRQQQEIKQLKQLIIEKQSSALIEVDGGVTLENAASIIQAGADVLVAGNTVFASTSPIDTIKQLKSIC